ncbi:MAG: ParB/RepB/Spo0J family partition protein [Terracidiphilus sp.]|nr:ParB/RepB/Spo0J family partition protein [Terracidiphilus sp.]MDR3799388.1 ParB/RepB/Spo0J family partition protein [Terracidiphilus sp.]
METTVINATEYRDLPLSQLSESKTNPRRVFDDAALQELASSIRSQGVLSPLLVRPLTENGFEIVAGARRYRAAQIAEQKTVPVRIKNITDAEVIEAQLVENLIRAEIHPMEEAEGFARLLALEEPKYSIEQIGGRVGKSPSFVASRIKLIDLAPAAVEAFYANEIGVGHALLLAKLPGDQQQQALSACFKEVYNGGQKPSRILLPVRNLQFWIESNVLLVLKDAPFDKRDAQLVAAAGSCADCPKRTGHNKLLFSDDLGRQGDRCVDPKCYQAKLTAHVAKTVSAKPQLVQISTAYGTQREGSSVLPRNKYTAIRDDKPKSNEEAKRPEFKVCKFTTDAIVTEGSEIGTIHKVCANPACPVHHTKKANGAGANDAAMKAEQEKRRREEAIANTTGLRVLSAIGAAIPVRLMKRDLLFVAERLAELLDENRAAILAKQHGIKKAKDNDSIGKLFVAFLRRADEGTLGRAVVEAVILLTASRGNASHVLRDAATAYKVDTDAIAAKVKQEFAAKEKAKTATKPTPKVPAKAQLKTPKKAAAA